MQSVATSLSFMKYLLTINSGFMEYVMCHAHLNQQCLSVHTFGFCFLPNLIHASEARLPPFRLGAHAHLLACLSRPLLLRRIASLVLIPYSLVRVCLELPTRRVGPRRQTSDKLCHYSLRAKKKKTKQKKRKCGN